jgi:hypothetical protein
VVTLATLWYLINKKVVEFYPLDNPGAYLLKSKALIPEQPYDKPLFQINTVTYLTGQQRVLLIRLGSRF